MPHQVVIGGLVAFALKKGALRDKAERSMRIDIMSKRRKKLYFTYCLTLCTQLRIKPCSRLCSAC